MFRTVPLFIIRSFSLYTQKWYMSYKTERNCSYVLILLASCQQTFMTYTTAVCTVHLVRFILRIFHDVRLPERQIRFQPLYMQFKEKTTKL